ncbi:autotransporter-associated beta strand repeat-containing protein [Phyllobacterium sp. SB3]|uniref:autotransporter-associated beta strand repeat-containing protein n=1 Tax=Phyllobacterium sp. SB3 TaxID=3156073 RepID=UPI0032AE9211
MHRSLRSLKSTTTLGGQILLLGVAFIGAGLLAPSIAVAQQYWDGQDTMGGSGVSGGDGIWDDTSTNWTDETGTSNSTWLGGVAVFSGNPGSVTVNSPQNITGLSFRTDGYIIQGSNLNLVGIENEFSVDEGMSASINSVVSGSGGLAKTSAGTLVLTGTNSYSGGTTISDGILQLGNGGTSGSLTGNITNNGQFVFNRSDELALDGDISGGGSVSQIGSGITILAGTNSYTGGTTITDGTLSVSADENLGAADGTLTLNGGTLQVTGTDFVELGTNRNFTMTGNGGGIDIYNAANSFVMSQILDGNGGFRKEGLGELVLAGDSSGFAGATEILAGTLLVDNKLGGNVSVLDQGTLGGNGTIGGNVDIVDEGIIAPGGTVGKLAIDGDLTLSSGSSSEFELGALGKNDFIAVGGNLTLDGTLNLSNAGGANGNAEIGYYRIMSYGGNLTDHGIAVGSVPGGLPGADISVDVQQSGYIDLVVSDGTEQYWNGDDDEGGSGTWNSNTDWVNADGGTPAPFTGGTAIFRNLGSEPESLVTINGSHSAESLQFVTNGYSLVSGANGTLVSNNLFRPMELRALEGVSASIEVPIVRGSFGACGGIEKTGGGSVKLGGANSHCGTTISDGTLSVSADENLGTANGSLTLNGGVLQVTGTELTGLSTNRNLTMTGNGGGIDVAAANNTFTVSQALSGSGAFSKQGAGTLVLTGNNSYSGGTTISDGILQLGNGGISGSMVGNIANNGQLAFNRSNTLTFGGDISGSGSVSQNGSGTTVLTGTNTYTGGTTIRGGKLSVSADENFGAANGSLRLDGGVLQVTGTDLTELGTSHDFTMTGNGGGIDVAAANNTFTVSQALSGSGAFSKQGAGTLVLTGNNSYTGGTTISGGVLQIGNGGTSGTVTGNIANNGQLAFNRANTLTFGGGISGSGSVRQDGSGTTVLTGTNTYTGGTTISDGILQVGSGGSSGSIVGNIANNGQLVLSRSDTLMLGGAISGTGSITQSGLGTTVLTGTNSYTGGTTISNGVLQLGNGGISGSMVGNIANNGQLAFNRSNTLTFGGDISGSGSVSQNGSGTTVLTGTNTYTGGTTIRGGKLSVSADENFGAANGSLRLDGGVLQVTGTDLTELGTSHDFTMTGNGGGIDVAAANNTFTVSQALSGSGAFSKQGAGTLVLTGNNSYTGGTTISGGVLQIGNGGTSGTVTGNIANNGQLAFNRSNTLTFGGGISGSGSVRQDGSGTTVLTGTNSYTGGTTISDGILQVGSGGSSGSIVGNIANNGQLVLSRSDTLMLGGAISGSGSVSQNGSGTTILTGDSSAFTGTTDVTSGRLRVDNNLGGDVNVAAGGQLGGNGTIGGNVDVASSATIAPGGSIGRLSIGGDLTLGAGSTSEFELSTPGTNADRGSSINDFIAVGGNLTLDGTLNLSNAGGAGIGYYRIMSYGDSLTDNGLDIGTLPDGLGDEIFTIDTTAESGYIDIVVSDGTEQYWKGDDNAGGNGTWNNDTLWVNEDRQGPAPFGGKTAIFKTPTGVALGGVVTVEGPQTVESLQFVSNGYSLVAGTNGALVAGDATKPMDLRVLEGVTTSIDVPVTSGAGGCGGIEKTGGGSVKLGGANSHCGTTISDGTLSVSADENLGTANGSLTLNGGVLQVTGTELTGLSTNRNLTMTGNGGGIDVDDVGNTFTVSQALSGTGAFSKEGAGTLVLTGTNTYTGGTTIRDGKLSVSADENLGAANGSLRLDGGVLQVTGTSFAEFDASRDLTMSSNGGGIDVAAANNSFTVSQALSGTGAFGKEGAGTLVLTGTNSYSGGTTISDGILQIGNGGTSGSVVGNIANNSQLAFNRSNTLTFGGDISGSGSVRQNGSGTTVLTGTNTYTGGTIVNAGTLLLSEGSTLGALNGSTTVNGGLLQLGGTSQTQANLSLTGGGASLVNDKTGDRFNITSNYQGGQSGQISLDIDLVAETADVVTIGGVAMGKMNLHLNNISEVTEPVLGSSILLVDIQGSGNDLAVTADGLPTGGVVRYDLVRQPASGGNGYQYVVKSGVDGNAASAVVSGFIAAQNVVASSFFKPSSGLVSAPIDPDKNQFGIAPWMRTNSGMSTIETSGTIRQPDGTLIDTPAKLDSRYIGYQFGFDGGFFNINDTDANINFGVTAGQIFGSSDQKNYDNTTDFQSVFYGAYAAFTKGPLFLDLQVRQELTDYTVNVNDEVFQIGGEKVSGTRNSIGGSASYTYARNDWSFIPAVGFTYSMNQTDDLSIPRNILLNQKEGKVRFDDVESMIGFGGLTVSRNYFVLDDRIRLSPFVTLTAYHDFAGDIDATMVIDQSSANPIVLPVKTKRLQTYGEASIGMNLLSLTGKIGGAERLMVGSVRGDFQFGEDVVGGALTAQFRMQF